MNKLLVLVVEDDPMVRNLITTTLKLHDYRYITAEDGRGALLAGTSHQPDLMLLDLGLPDMDGVEIIENVRTWSQMPIIVISARSEDSDKVKALDAGADDYIVKPFSVDELLARLRVTARRLAYMAQISQDDVETVYENGPLRIDWQAGIVSLAGEEIHLTPYEYKLLCLLAKNTGKVLTHTYITREIWGSSTEHDIGTLRVFMASLRKKIDPDSEMIQTHVGIGYRLVRV